MNLRSRRLQNSKTYLYADPRQLKGTKGSVETKAYLQSRRLDRFVFIRLDYFAGARKLPSIYVDRRQAELFSFKLEEVGKLFADDKNKCAQPADAPFGYDLLATYSTEPNATEPEFGVYRGADAIDRELLPSYILKSDNLRLTFKNIRSNEFITRYADCLSSARGAALPVGYFNFVDHILDMQTYTYATLPRIDLLVTDASSDTARRERLQAEVPNSGGSAVIDNYYRRAIRSVDPKTSIVGFSESLAPGELKFGWVMSPIAEVGRPGGVLSYRPMEPTQRSLSALVTMPAWWSRARVEVTTGWIDDSGKFSDGDKLPFSIPLPIDYELLDNILVQPGRRESRPSIALERLPDSIAVRACETATILVPGNRLWRSSVVVLGGQRANDVTVLPDMRGIIATFNSVAAQDATDDADDADDADNAHEAVRMLQVWTSEGVTGPIPVKIKGGAANCRRPELGSNNTPASTAAPAAPSPTLKPVKN